MSTVVYFANKQVQVVTGTEGTKKVSLKNGCLAEAPEGSIINGMIMDTELFTDFIKTLWEKENLPKKDVIVVVNSNKFIGKKLEIPVLNDAKTIEYIEREYGDVRQEGESIYSYIPISSAKGKMRKFYVEGISADFLQDYLDIFSNAGIKVKALYSGESSIIGFAGVTLGEKYKTFALQVADGMMITTLLWVDGEFYYFNSTRCFHDKGTEDYAQDIARTVSQLTQFMQANQIESQLERIVLAGIEPANLSMYQDAIEQQGISVPTELFETDAISTGSMSLQDYLFAISGLFVHGKWQNFLNKLLHGKKKKDKDGEGTKDIILIVAILVVMLIGVAASLTFKKIKQKELDKLVEYNEDPVVMMQVADYDKLLNRNDFLQGQLDSIEGLNANYDTYPVCNDKVTGIIDSCAKGYATVTYNSFDSSAGIVSITAKSAVVDDINKFIKNLNEQEIFSKIDYSGYTYQESNGMWDIKVTCTLAESAGR